MEATEEKYIRDYIKQYTFKLSLTRPVSLLEAGLWRIARTAKHCPAIIWTNKREDDPYLLRVYLTPPREKIANQIISRLRLNEEQADWVRKMPRPYLHYFFRGDHDRAWHNHPWHGSLSYVLTGGYFEQRFNRETREITTRHVRPGSFNYIARDTFHKVELVPGSNAWTLFISGERVDEERGFDWSFLDTDTMDLIPWSLWEDYLRKKGIK